jgi:excisionase family DNA binding protein
VDLRTAAEQLGVHYQTAYRWVRDGSLPAVKIGASYEVRGDDVQALAFTRSQGVPPPERAEVRDWSSLVERFTEQLLDGDELAARHAVDRLVQGNIEPLLLCSHLFAPAMRSVGRRWEAGVINVATEHRATAICSRQLARIAQHPRGRPRGTCIVGTPAGEQHGLPAAMASVVLRADRWRVHHLGTQVPDDDLLALSVDEGAALVVLSVTLADMVQPTISLANRIQEIASVTVLVGRPGASLPTLLEKARAAKPSNRVSPATGGS